MLQIGRDHVTNAPWLKVTQTLQRWAWHRDLHASHGLRDFLFATFELGFTDRMYRKCVNPLVDIYIYRHIQIYRYIYKLDICMYWGLSPTYYPCANLY